MAASTVPEPTDTAADGPADDRSPRVGKADKADKPDGDTRTPEMDGAVAFLPPELALSDILPFTPTLASASASDVPAPPGAPAGEAVADYGRSPRRHWSLLAGLAVSLTILLGGGGALWWRNRDSHYWPA